jgi:hypothetical protein
LIGESEGMREVMVQVEQMAPVSSTVLIEGESGTGKELVARAMRLLSNRRNKPFIAVNVGALPETLLESELFGHEKGAFTGAAERRLGRFGWRTRGRYSSTRSARFRGPQAAAPRARGTRVHARGRRQPSRWTARHRRDKPVLRSSSRTESSGPTCFTGSMLRVYLPPSASAGGHSAPRRRFIQDYQLHDRLHGISAAACNCSRSIGRATSGGCT